MNYHISLETLYSVLCWSTFGSYYNWVWCYKLGTPVFGQSPLGAIWQTPSVRSCVFYWGMASIWPLYHKGLIGGVLQRWLSHFHRGPPELGQSAQGPSPQIAQFGQAVSSRKSLRGFKLLPFKKWRPLCSWEPSMLQNCFGIFPQICASTKSHLGALRTIPSTSWLGFCSDMHC